MDCSPVEFMWQPVSCVEQLGHCRAPDHQSCCCTALHGGLQCERALSGGNADVGIVGGSEAAPELSLAPYRGPHEGSVKVQELFKAALMDGATRSTDQQLVVYSVACKMYLSQAALPPHGAPS